MMRQDTARSLSAVLTAVILLSTAGLSAVPGHTSFPEQTTATASDTVPLHDSEPKDTVRSAPADSTDADNDVTRQGTRSGDYADGAIPVPEQPEATAFAPTMMEQYTAADPMAGITLITPPSANNRGTASLQYPFIMPPVRNGMSPSLGLSYDSDAGDGLCGEGWTLPIPSVTVDTRWGVPRYDPSKETETYLLNGQMLGMQIGRDIYLAHRHPGVNRNTSDSRRFRPRVESDFSLIERTGLTPSTYQWKVTAPDGTLYTYGGGNATLKGSFTDASGATRTVISEWLLSRVEDPHGDYVAYEYETASDTVMGGLISKVTYLKNVRSVIRLWVDNSYSEREVAVVSLHYKNRGDSVTRTCSARYGYLTSSGRLLDSVKVTFQGRELRSYGLRYARGRFGKPLLTRVTHFDDGHNVASFQDFGYYDDVSESGTGISLFSADAEVIPATPTGVEAEFARRITDYGVFSSHPTAIGGNKGKSFSASLYAGVGFGVSNDKANTAGVSVGYSRSTMTGAVTLADLNGDGLPDQVCRLNDSTWYRPMTPDAAGPSFGPSVLVEGAPDFSRSVTTSMTGGPKVHVRPGLNGIAEAGLDLMMGSTKTTAYMADVNGDGLTDIVNNGKVYFGRLNAQGAPSFSTASSLTPNPITCTGTIVTDEDSLLTSERDTLVKYSPMQDVVRIWRAPFPGTVSVTGSVRLLLPASPTDENGDPVSPDGVHVSIQKGDTELFQAQLDTTTTQGQTNCGGITVSAGDTIFFRVQCGRDSLSNGYHDKVLWSQTVKYVDNGLSYPTMPNGESQNIHRSEEAAFVSSRMLVDVNGTTFTVRGELTKVATTDDVFVRIWTMNEQYDTLGLPNPNFQRRLRQTWSLGKAAYNTNHYWVVPNPEHDPYALLEVYSASNVDWNGVSWTPEIIVNGDTTAVVPHYSAYPMQRWRGAPYRAESADSLIITPSLTLSGTHSVNMTVKKKGAFISRKRLESVNGVQTVADSTLRIRPSAGDSIWVEYFVEDDSGLPNMSQPGAVFRVVGAGTSHIKDCNLFQQSPESACGTMYGGWGAFAYGAGGERYAHIIDRSLLEVPRDSSAADPLSMALIPLMPREREGIAVWEGANTGVYICGDTLSAARLLVNDVSAQSAMPGVSAPLLGNENDGSEGRGVTLRTASTSTALMAGAGAGPLSLSKSDSNGGSESSTAFTDMNGDGYPDIINGGKIQYTNTLGGFSDERCDGFGSTEEASSWQRAYSQGAAPQHSHTLSGRRSVGGAAVSTQQASNGSYEFGQNFPTGGDNVSVLLADVNGDGLPDRVRSGAGSGAGSSSGLWVRLNLGYSFSPEVGLTTVTDILGKTEHRGFDASAGISLPTGYDRGATSFAGGLNTAAVSWDSSAMLADVNGDGLPDIVRRSDGGARAFLNNGAGFFPVETGLPDLVSLGGGTSTTMSANVAATFSFTVFGVKTAVTPSANTAATMARTTSILSDIDGDGFPDLVSSDSESGLSVRCSTIRRTNRLRTVTNSLGGTFTIDYAHTTPTYGLPGGKWVMSSVEVDRGIHFPGYDIPVTRRAFTYSSGMRDRREREFLGFAEVVSTDLDTRDGDAPRRSLTETFNVSSYYNKGLPLTVTLRDAAGDKFTETESVYYKFIVKPDTASTTVNTLADTEPSDTWPVAYTPVRFREKRFYEGGTAAVKEQSAYQYKAAGCGEVERYYYSGKGNMSPYSFTNRDYYTYLAYSAVEGDSAGHQRRTISRPASATVWNRNSARIRKTTATYCEGRNAAKAATVTRTISETPSVTSVTSYSYDAGTGNLISVRRNSESGDLIYTYQYNNDFLQTYPNKITAPHDLSTNIEGMSLAYGLPTQQKDPNNKVLSTIYDGLGRLISVKSPNENTPYQSTVDMSYTPMAVMRADGQGIQTPAHAVATHHLRQPYVTSQGHFTHDDSMRVVTFVDGFGEVLQTRRESVIDNGSGGQCRKVIVDGCKAYDGLGRAVRAFYPAEADSANLMVWQPTAQAGEQGIVTEYDVLDRPVTVTTPDTTVTRYCYDVSGGCLRTAVTDPLGHRSETYADASGRTVRTVMYRDSAATQPIETRYVYDPVGRLTTVIDAGGDSTLITYDMLDRRTEVRHPASGTTRWTYDRLGNVLTEENETLRAQGDAIRYTWDIDRLTEEVCQGDTVRLFYGDANSSELTNGRLRFRLDRSGGTEYQYNNMGNVSFERRTVIVPGKGHATFETSWEYDSYGKLLRMTYPGDEAVIYLYNSTGDLRRVYAGNEDGGNDYVSSISYDRFGDRVRMTHGNGATMQYGYNPRTRRLSSLYLTTDRFMELSKAYAYDKAGNIVRSEGFLNSQLIHSYDYSYDALGRLSSATQYCLDGPSWAKDTLSMSYDDLWRITSKSQHVSGDGIMSPQPLYAGYDMTYTYGTEPGRRFRMDRVAETHYRTEGTPTAADRIRSTHSYSYDANGNLVYMATDRTRSDGGSTPKISERKLLWDARNRLRALSDDGYVSLYWYDADGNRTVKEHHGGEAVWVNSAPAGQRTDSVVYSVYPNPYINVNGDHWTKHYYIGGERVASRTGTLSGGFDDLHIPSNNPASAGTGVTLDYSAMRRAEEDSVVSVYERLGVPYEPQRVGTRGEGGHLYIPITRDEQNACDIGAETAETPEGSPQRSHPNTLGEGQVYYYHRDHLGSTQSVTDGDGDFTQFVEYTPWGEVFVELKGDSVLTTPYLFNGKELDEETGLYYYGARYYDPKMSVWYSTDPMQEKYPWVTTYGYCMNNPLKLIDPNGEEIRINWTLKKGEKIIQRYFVYKNGKLYFENGKLYQGNISYVRKVQKDLNLLSIDSPKLKNRIKELERSKHIHIITLGDSKQSGNSNQPANKQNDESHIPTGSLTKYNPYSDYDINGEKRTARIGLAHELLGHGYNSDKGTSDYSKTSNNIMGYEIQAVNIENVARAAIKEPKRKTYGEEKIPERKLWDTHK